MKRNRILPLCVIALFIVTCALTALQNCAHTEPSEGNILIINDNSRTTLSLADLPAENVSGELINGKGEHTNIDAEGIEIRTLFESCGFTPAYPITVIVTAADNYSAEVSGEEILEPGKAFLILQDKSCRLVVFGDPNSKRSVRDVRQLEIKPVDTK